MEYVVSVAINAVVQAIAAKTSRQKATKIKVDLDRVTANNIVMLAAVVKPMGTNVITLIVLLQDQYHVLYQS